MSTLIFGKCETVGRSLKWMRRWQVKESSGFVIFFNGEATAWSRDLPEPFRNRPGCIAVNIATGERYEAMGGNYQDGHAGWVPVSRDVIALNKEPRASRRKGAQVRTVNAA